MFDSNKINLIISGLSSLKDYEEGQLMWKIVDLIREKGEFFFVGLYLLDSHKEFAIIKCGTGFYSKKLVEKGHRLRILSKENLFGPVAYSIWLNQLFFCDFYAPPRISYSPNFPETQWEMGVPLRINNQVIGALEIDDDKRAMFREEDMIDFQKVADEVTKLLDKYDLI